MAPRFRICLYNGLSLVSPHPVGEVGQALTDIILAMVTRTPTWSQRTQHLERLRSADGITIPSPTARPGATFTPQCRIRHHIRRIHGALEASRGRGRTVRTVSGTFDVSTAVAYATPVVRDGPEASNCTAITATMPWVGHRFGD